MIDMQPLQFTANARLKDIIGRELIYNDNIAVLELVKNAKDAGSPDVSIEIAECDQKSGESKLIISDRGEGMSFDDIKNKWLNIAYSDKRDARPTTGGFFAGSKGIGRFSCDRLGKTLDVYTRTKGGDIIALHVDWENYEVNDQSSTIGDIDVQVRYVSNVEMESESGLKGFSHGTVLVIRDLRSPWTKDSLLSLRKELERFSIDPDGKFEVFLSDWRFDNDDEVNQPIENKVFSDLDVRTTSISARIDGDGNEIEIELRHDGDYIFRVQEANPYSEIKGIEAKIYFLNQPAKSFFKRRTGYSLEQFGSIHLFLNGFRISPYGNYGNDWLGLNSRESEHQRRNIRTKDVVGFVRLIDRAGSFETVSSREGLVDNLGFRQLTSQGIFKQPKGRDSVECGLIYKLVYKLEKFVIEGLDWDKLAGNESIETPKELNGNFEYLEQNNQLLQSIAPVVRCKATESIIKNISVNIDYITRIAEQTSLDYQKQIEYLEEKLTGLPVNKLLPAEHRDVSKLINRISETVSEKNRAIASLKEKDAENKKKLNAEKDRRIFAEKFYDKDCEKLAQINHQVGLLAISSIQKIDRVYRKFHEDTSRYSKEYLIKILNECHFKFRRIYKIANLILKANFDLTNDRVQYDLIQFIEEYLNSDTSTVDAFYLKVSIENSNNIKIPMVFRPSEVTILIDNLLRNSGKAKAKEVIIRVTERVKTNTIAFIDNGIGLTEKYSPEDLFENGITTTSGSGIGLQHVRQIVNELNGKVSIRNGPNVGAIVEVELKKNEDDL